MFDRSSQSCPTQSILYVQNHSPSSRTVNTAILDSLTMQPTIENDHVSDVSSALLGISCPTNESSSITASEQFYVSRGRSLKALAILCQGLLDDDGALLFDPKVMPWSAADKVSSVKPNAADLKEEVKRRASMNPKIVIAPRPSAWTLQRLTEWLNEHPISGADDVAFIKKTVIERVTTEENAAKEKGRKNKNLLVGGLENIQCSD